MTRRVDLRPTNSATVMAGTPASSNVAHAKCRRLWKVTGHPGYLGQLMVFAGVGVALANWLSIATMVVFPFVAFRWRIGVEEAALQARFADQFEAYRRRSWRLIPWLY